MKYKIGDKIKVIKNLHFTGYPKTATGLIKWSKQLVGKNYEIVSLRPRDLYGKFTIFKYGIYAPSLTYCADEELQKVGDKL